MSEDRRAAWEPTESYVNDTRLSRTMSRAGLDDYDEFLRWGVAHPDEFWAATLDELGFTWATPYDQFEQVGSGPGEVRWFVGGRTNVVTQALTRWSRGPRADETALIDVDESGATRILTYAELDARVGAAAAGLAELGVQPGDRVAIYLPYTVEAATALLAVAALGAIAVPVFSGYGVGAVAARLRSSGPRVVVASRSTVRRGRSTDYTAVLDEALRQAGQEAQLVWVGGAPGTPLRSFEHDWDALMARHEGTPWTPLDVESNTPVIIAYTSGTTGEPKGVVHTHTGLPLKVAQEMAQLMDIGVSSTLLRITDMGWIGGPYTILSGLMVGASVVMYSGTPTWPTSTRLWELVAEHGVTHLGISPTLARMLRVAGAAPTAEQIATLRMTSTTGEPWDEGAWDWYMDAVGGGRLPIVNHSGGTEVGNLLCCIPVRPISFGRFNSAVPGVDVAVLSEDGADLLDQSGELVVQTPFVGLTQGLFGNQERFIETYWSRYPGRWLQGDRAVHHGDGSWELRGRSDDRMKIAGRSVAPSDVESVVLARDDVSEAAAIGVPDVITGTRIILFVVARDADRAGADLAAELLAHTATQLGKALAPSAVHVVPSLPHTPGGKLLRRAVRDVFVDPAAGLAKYSVARDDIGDEGIAALRDIADVGQLVRTRSNELHDLPKGTLKWTSH